MFVLWEFLLLVYTIPGILILDASICLAAELQCTTWHHLIGSFIRSMYQCQCTEGTAHVERGEPGKGVIHVCSLFQVFDFRSYMCTWTAAPISVAAENRYTLLTKWPFSPGSK